MLDGIRQRLHRDQRGITGLETAIILIAFVVVASVFAYTVLSAGIFSSEKGKEAIYAGLEGARSSMTITGGVIAKDTDGDDDVDQLIFVLTNALAGEAIDFNETTDTDFDGLLSDEASKNHTTIISYIDSTQSVSDLAWTKLELGKGDGDALLEVGEKFEVTVYIASALTTDPDEYDQFTIEVKPDGGAALIFERTLPAVIDDVMDLK
ncbi:MAG: flagellin [Chloroflexi bacterium]|nr:flagellin [Chloroflexota bacterium]